MFKYGKKAGYMGIALLVLAVIPLVVAAFVIPNIGPEVATKFNAAGEVTRWGKSYELLALPVLNLLLSVATYFTAGRQAKNNEDSAVMARHCVRALPAQRLHHGRVPQCNQRLLYVFGDYWNGLWLWFLACPFRQRACTHIQWLLRGRRSIVVERLHRRRPRFRIRRREGRVRYRLPGEGAGHAGWLRLRQPD